MNEISKDASGLFTRSVFRVALPNVTPVWNQVAPWFEPIFAERPTHNAHDVWKIIMSEQAQLWVQWCQDQQRIESAFVTEFGVYPRGVWVRIWLGAALPKTNVEYSLIQAAMSEWARTHGARGFEIIGRHGWLHKFPEAKVEGLAMRVT